MSKMGRPKIELTQKELEQVEKLCAIHCTAKEICGVMNICEETLNRIIKEKYDLTFSEFRERYSAHGKSSLRRAQFKLAEKSAAMAIFLGKQYLGQKDSFEDSNIKPVINIITPTFKEED